MRSPCLPVAVLVALLSPELALAQSGEEVVAASAVYVRQDNNATTVVSPHLRVAAPLAEGTRAEAKYTVDVWTSASVDIVSAATPRVTEQRDEIDLSLTQAIGDATVTGAYRFSDEHDYTSHGGTLAGTLELAQKSSTVGASFTYLEDDVGRAGDPQFQRETKTFSARLSFTQILTPKALAQAVYEYGNTAGYLASPYRYVAFWDPELPVTWGCRQVLVPTEDGLSTTTVVPASCQPEVNPDARTRHALALRGRYALGDSYSVGGGYRFYLDTWEVMSHTLDANLAWAASPQWLLEAEYRFYTQGAAKHYERVYFQGSQPTHFTSDKELSPLMSNRLGLRVLRTVAVDQVGSRLRFALAAGLIQYSYSDFLALDAITALETTFALEYLL